MNKKLTYILIAFIIILPSYNLSMNSGENNSGKENSVIGRVSRKTNKDGAIIYSKDFTDGKRWICKKFKNGNLLCFCVVGNSGKSSKVLPSYTFEQLQCEYQDQHENQKNINMN